MRVGPLLLLATIALLAATGTAVAADNTAPLADGGVDQTVPVNSSVYLDANGSADPDGDIESVSWTIEAPNGTTTTPECRDCRRTEFEADAVGQYTVTLSVTDDDGATRSDTLYVTVATESGPAVSLSGPEVAVSGTSATFSANVTGDDAELQSLAWVVDGDVVDRTLLNDSTADASFTHSFNTTGEKSVRAVVYDTLGNRGSATHRISVAGGGGRGTGDFQCFDQVCGNGADKIYTFPDGSTYIVDMNDRDGIQLHTGTGENSLTDYGDNLVKSGDLVKTNGGAYKVTGGQALREITTEERETDSPINQNSTNNDTAIGNQDKSEPDRPESKNKNPNTDNDGPDEGSDGTDSSSTGSNDGPIHDDNPFNPFSNGNGGTGEISGDNTNGNDENDKERNREGDDGHNSGIVDTVSDFLGGGGDDDSGDGGDDDSGFLDDFF